MPRSTSPPARSRPASSRSSCSASPGASGSTGSRPSAPPGGPRIGTNAVCLLASITKPIVATAVMRLAQDGRFPLTVPLSRWVPELDAAGPRAVHRLARAHPHHGPRATSTSGRSRAPGRRPRDEVIRRTIDAGPGRHARERGSCTPPSPWTCCARPWSGRSTGRSRRSSGRPCSTRWGWPTRRSTTPGRATGARPIQLGDWDGTLREVPPGIDPDADPRGVRRRCGWPAAGCGARRRTCSGSAGRMLRGGELDGVRILGRPIVDLMTREVTVDGLGAIGDRLADEHYAIGWGKPGPAARGRRWRSATAGSPGRGSGSTRPRTSSSSTSRGTWARRRRADRRRADGGLRGPRLGPPARRHVARRADPLTRTARW